MFFFFDDFQYWINIIVNPIGRWWKVIKHSVAWRLLEVAKTGDYIDRLKAVRQLATIRHLKGNAKPTIMMSTVTNQCQFHCNP